MMLNCNYSRAIESEEREREKEEYDYVKIEIRTAVTGSELITVRKCVMMDK